MKGERESFEEQFPSMKGEICFNAEGEFCYIQEIKKHCLDKAKVREAIDSWKQTAICTSGEYTCNRINFVLRGLKKELDL